MKGRRLSMNSLPARSVLSRLGNVLPHIRIVRMNQQRAFVVLNCLRKLFSVVKQIAELHVRIKILRISVDGFEQGCRCLRQHSLRIRVWLLLDVDTSRLRTSRCCGLCRSRRRRSTEQISQRYTEQETEHGQQISLPARPRSVASRTT